MPCRAAPFSGALAAAGALLAAALFAAAGPARAGEWQCLSGSGGAVRVLALEKGITRGEHDRFRSAFRQCFPDSYTGQRTVDLDSGGGSVVEALKIARDLVDWGSGPRPIATQVSPGGVCISACTYLFVAGRLRNVRTGGSFEPHGFSSFKGPRIDAAIEAIRDKDGTLQWPRLELQVARLQVLAGWLPALARGDARLGFAVEWLGDIAARLARLEVTRPEVARLAERFLALPPAQRAFIQNLDAILHSAIPELERVAALKGFEPVLTAAGSAPVTLDERRYFEWVVGEFALAANAYLRSVNDTRPVKLGDDFLRGVLTLQRERVADVVSTVRDELGPYLQTRADQIDIAGLVRLMFSVSILYTRPLTREELCDLNIVNRDCGN